MFRKPHDLSRLLYYKNMAHEELWLECAQKLTTVIQQIIEFAKMVPGFMKLSQDDQIVLLKAGKFLTEPIKVFYSWYKTQAGLLEFYAANKTS